MVCAVEEIENSTLFGGTGEIVSKTLENRILLPSVSTLLSPIIGQYNFLMLSRVSVRVTKNYVLPMDSTHYICFRPREHQIVTMSHLVSDFFCYTSRFWMFLSMLNSATQARVDPTSIQLQEAGNKSY